MNQSVHKQGKHEWEQIKLVIFRAVCTAWIAWLFLSPRTKTFFVIGAAGFAISLFALMAYDQYKLTKAQSSPCATESNITGEGK